MSFDNSRYTFNPFKDYSSVVVPQGRVQADSDLNEALEEIARRIQAGTLDTMGRAAYPLTTPNAFYVSPGTTPWVVNLGLGRMYVDGLLAENHGAPPGTWDPALEEASGTPQPQPATVSNTPSIPFTSQPYLPAAAKTLAGATQYLPKAAGSYVFYLDVWKRAVTWLQDPTLIDSAIGIDTSGRMQTVWQVRWMSANAGGVAVSCSTPDADISYPSTSAGQLSTQVLPNPTSGPCCLTPGTGYTGLENQFYRVQIHQGGPLGSATFKWSRENASVATGVTAIAVKGNAAGDQTTVLTVTSLGRDQVLNFSNGNWIELLDDNAELDGMPDANSPTPGPYNCGTPGLLCQIDYVDPTTNQIYLVAPPLTDPRFPSGTPDTAVHTRIVRWDESGTVYSADSTGKQTATPNGLATGDIQTPADGTTMLVLENGIVVTFNVSAASGVFLSGDYWTFAARTDGTLDPPTLVKASPRGIQHHYTKLSVVTFDASGNATNTPDCRTQWGCGCAGDCGCCTVTVGDNVNSFGTYSSIQQAIYNLPATGGEVCILPGRYYELVVISNAIQVTLKGSGPQTILYPPSARPPGTADQSGNTIAPTTASGLNAVLTIANSQHIRLTGFTVEAPTGMACVLLDTLVAGSQAEIDAAKQAGITLRAKQIAKKAKISMARGVVQEGNLPPAAFDQPGVFGNIPPRYNPSNMGGLGYGWLADILSPSNIDVTLDTLILTAVNLPAIASVKASLVKICDNRVFMQDLAGLWAAVYVSGTETTIERNWIGLENVADASSYASNTVVGDLSANFRTPTTSPKGNGGIQVGGYSSDISIVNNEIEGGAFNAITLGSYVLNGTTQGTVLQGLFPVSPAGNATLVLPSASGNSLVMADGPLENIRIEDNQISNCGLCGIGPVGFFGSQSPEAVSVASLSIVGNSLSGTMNADPGPLPAGLAGTVGYGAICLPDLQNCTIRDNTITDFGVTPGAQVCGIFVLNAEQIEISRNKIVETRDWLTLDQVPAAHPGLQAGVAIAMVSPPALNQSTSSTWSGDSAQGVTTAGNPPIYQPGMPALRMEQNVVRVALGYSLTVLGYGPLSITGNHLATGGTVASPSGPVPIALNIFILNLGLAVEFDQISSFSTLWTHANANASPPTLSSLNVDLGNSTSGSTLFAHNQCQVETRGSGASAPCSSFIASLDSLNYANNLSWMDGTGAAVADALILGMMLQVTSNRFQEPLGSVLLSGLTAGLFNITKSNISTLCLLARGARVLANDNLSFAAKDDCEKRSTGLLEAVVLGLFSAASQLETITGVAEAGAALAGTSSATAPSGSTAPAPAQPTPAEPGTPGAQSSGQQAATGAASGGGPTMVVPEAVLKADKTSADGAKALLMTHQARLAQVTRTAAAITKQAGAPPASVAAAKAAVSSAQALVARVGMLRQRVSAQAPIVPATGWGIYGAVYNATGAPVHRYSVYLVNSANTYQNTLGIAYTQADGSYEFVYGGPATGQVRPTGPFYLQVANAIGQPIYTSKSPIAPTIGTATYRVITLPAQEVPLGILPRVLRSVTVPARKRPGITPKKDT